MRNGAPFLAAARFHYFCVQIHLQNCLSRWRWIKKSPAFHDELRRVFRQMKWGLVNKKEKKTVFLTKFSLSIFMRMAAQMQSEFSSPQFQQSKGCFLENYSMISKFLI